MLQGARIMDGSGWVQEPVRRDRGGRFVAGVSGNPAGKRKGTPNRLTMLKLALSVDESGAVARVVIDRALAGDMIAARLCLEAILPKAPTVVPSLAQAAVGLHSACNCSESAAPRPPLPEFGSACIRPAISRRASRRAGPTDPAAAATDRLHPACNFSSRGTQFPLPPAVSTSRRNSPARRPTRLPATRSRPPRLGRRAIASIVHCDD
jgi:hypothetical protein